MEQETERYEPEAIEAKWQAIWAAEEAFTVPNPDPGPGAAAARAVDVRPRDAPVPVGRAPHGARLQLHARRRLHARPAAAGTHRAAPDGLRRVRAARRERGDQARAATRARSRRATSQSIRRQMKRMGWAIDWSREVSTAEPEYYRWTQWLFLRFFERGLAYRREAPGQVVPERPDRARERAGDRRPLRALRHRGRGAEPDAVVLQDHRLRRPAARRDGPARVVARARPDDAAQLDRPLGGRARHVHGRRERARSCPSSRRGRTRCSARRSSCWRPSTRLSRS